MLAPLRSPEDERPNLFKILETVLVYRKLSTEDTLLVHRSDKRKQPSLLSVMVLMSMHSHPRPTAKPLLYDGPDVIIAWRAFRKFRFQGSTIDQWRLGMQLWSLIFYLKTNTKPINWSPMTSQVWGQLIFSFSFEYFGCQGTHHLWKLPNPHQVVTYILVKSVLLQFPHQLP